MRPRNRSKFQAILSSPITLVLAAIIFYFLARAAWNIHEKARESAERLASAQNDLSKLQQSQKALEDSVDKLSTSAGVEAEIREKYHAVQPGESVAVIVDTPPVGTNGSNAATASAASPSVQAPGFWARLLQLFGL
jgi:cell division protein FtsB